MPGAINKLISRLGTSPEEINRGDCLYFAGEIAKMVPGVECHWDTDLDADDHRGHMVMRYRGRWYDAERPEGVDEWRQLPAYSRDSGWRLRGGEWVKT